MQFRNILVASLFSLAAAATGKLGDAAKVTDNPVGKCYEAIFTGEKGVTGTFAFGAGKGGRGVDVSVNVQISEHETGPFGYHIHDQPVPDSGDCAGTKAHLDPYQRGQEPACVSFQPATCEVGDLSGKHGKLGDATSSARVTVSESYNDLYISTKKGIGAFIGNRSLVIHRPDAAKSRLACVNLVEKPCTTTGLVDVQATGTVTGTAAGSTGTGSSGSGKNSSSTVTSPGSPSNAPSDNGAGVVGVSSVIAIGGVIAGMLML